MRCSHCRLFYLVLLLLAAAANPRAADPQPVWTIDLKPLGYPTPDAHSYTVTKMGFWRQYVKIESTLVVCGKCRPDSTHQSTPGPTLIIDASSGQQASLDAVAGAAWDWAPEDLPEECPIPTAKPAVLSRWRGMTLSCAPGHLLYLNEPGREQVILHSGQYFKSATFLAPDRILIKGDIDDKPGCTICHPHYLVVDKTGAVKYKMEPFWWRYIAINRETTRFAVYDNVLSGPQKVFGIFTAGAEPAMDEAGGRVRVFSTESGNKLFEYKWSLKSREHRVAGKIALSDDGSLLALIAGSRLLIFRVGNAGRLSGSGHM